MDQWARGLYPSPLSVYTCIYTSTVDASSLLAPLGVYRLAPPVRALLSTAVQVEVKRSEFVATLCRAGCISTADRHRSWTTMLFDPHVWGVHAAQYFVHVLFVIVVVLIIIIAILICIRQTPS
jgi:hypothetical protein